MEYLFKTFILFWAGGVVLDLVVFRFKYHKEIFGFFCFISLVTLLVVGLCRALA